MYRLPLTYGLTLTLTPTLTLTVYRLPLTYGLPRLELSAEGGGGDPIRAKPGLKVGVVEP